jgi:hypothetical protein
LGILSWSKLGEEMASNATKAPIFRAVAVSCFVYQIFWYCLEIYVANTISGTNYNTFSALGRESNQNFKCSNPEAIAFSLFWPRYPFSMSLSNLDFHVRI